MFCVQIKFLAYRGLVRLILYVFRNIFCLSEGGSGSIAAALVVQRQHSRSLGSAAVAAAAQQWWLQQRSCCSAAAVTVATISGLGPPESEY